MRRPCLSSPPPAGVELVMLTPARGNDFFLAVCQSVVFLDRLSVEGVDKLRCFECACRQNLFVLSRNKLRFHRSTDDCLPFFDYLFFCKLIAEDQLEVAGIIARAILS